MSNPRSKLVSSIRTLCDELPDEPIPNGLPSSLIFEVLCDCESEMLRDLDLSNQNRRVNPTPMEITLTDGEAFNVTATDFNAPAFARLQTDSSSEIWYPVEIVNHSSLAQMGIDGILALAFTGSPQKGFISWIPENLQTLQVYYDRAGNDDPSMSESTELGNLYDAYLKLQAAAQCRELLKMDVGGVMAARLDKSERQWKRYVNMSRQQGQASKSMVFTPPRYRRRNYPGLDRTRFFLP